MKIRIILSLFVFSFCVNNLHSEETLNRYISITKKNRIQLVGKAKVYLTSGSIAAMLSVLDSDKNFDGEVTFEAVKNLQLQGHELFDDIEYVENFGINKIFCSSEERVCNVIVNFKKNIVARKVKHFGDVSVILTYENLLDLRELSLNRDVDQFKPELLSDKIFHFFLRNDELNEENIAGLKFKCFTDDFPMAAVWIACEGEANVTISEYLETEINSQTTFFTSAPSNEISEKMSNENRSSNTTTFLKVKSSSGEKKSASSISQ